jgi:hypothetical protein
VTAPVHLSKRLQIFAERVEQSYFDASTLIQVDESFLHLYMLKQKGHPYPIIDVSLEPVILLFRKLYLFL